MITGFVCDNEVASVGGGGGAPNHRATSDVMSSRACSPKEISSLVLSVSPVEKSVMVASGSACLVTGSVTCSLAAQAQTPRPVFSERQCGAGGAAAVEAALASCDGCGCGVCAVLSN